jgi:hypothetical protein
VFLLLHFPALLLLLPQQLECRPLLLPLSCALCGLFIACLQPVLSQTGLQGTPLRHALLRRVTLLC